MDYALVIVDMIKDNIDLGRGSALDQQSAKIIPVINKLSKTFRSSSHPVIFACDSFMTGDFIFNGRMKPHAIRGTGGDLPIKELDVQPSDLILAKRRMSAFHKTDLDQTLRTWKVKTVVVCGIMTHVCVLLTALDALQNDFNTIIVTDASACYKAQLHHMTIQLYESMPLFPLFRLMSSKEVITELSAQ
ncbi:MAG: cysteine hydrolase family protein [Desulfomonilaceae bacterium]